MMSCQFWDCYSNLCLNSTLAVTIEREIVVNANMQWNCFYVS